MLQIPIWFFNLSFNISQMNKATVRLTSNALKLSFYEIFKLLMWESGPNLRSKVQCILASLKEGLSVCPPVRLSVHPPTRLSFRPSITNSVTSSFFKCVLASL